MRTFIAIELPAAAKQRVIERQRSLQRLLDEQGVGIAFRWTPADNLHLTLRFLGETGDNQRRQLEEALASIAAQSAAFSLALQAAGAFPNLRKPNILWLDFGGDLNTLAPLQRRIELAVQQAGFTAEQRAFTPHMTVARAQKNAAPSTLARAGEALRTVTALPSPAGTPFAVEAFYLIRSDLNPTGSIYTPLRAFALRQNAA
jgi:RNA 2',3'-cyclic 3'-phosphodiesterase